MTASPATPATPAVTPLDFGIKNPVKPVTWLDHKTAEREAQIAASKLNHPAGKQLANA